MSINMMIHGAFCEHSGITFSCILKACGNMTEIEKEKHVHAKIVSLGLLDGNVVLGNALIDMYVKCGVLASK